MTRDEIETRLQLPVLNLCLAVVSEDWGDLALTKGLLLDAVEKIVGEVAGEAALPAAMAAARAAIAEAEGGENE